MSVHVEDLADAYVEIARLRDENARLTSEVMRRYLTQGERADLAVGRDLMLEACTTIHDSPLIKMRRAATRRAARVIERLIESDEQPTR